MSQVGLKQILADAGLRVGGWIADKELAVGKAVQEVFEGVPFQHCQAHFLGAMKKPLTQADTGLGKTVKKNFGKLRPIERSIAAGFEQGSINSAERQCLEVLCGTIRSWTSRSLSHKHRFKGVELYEAMSQISTDISGLQKQKDHTVLRELQKGLASGMDGLQTDYQALKQGQDILNHLTDSLYGVKDGKGIRNTI